MARKQHPHKRAIPALREKVVEKFGRILATYPSRKTLRERGEAWWLKKKEVTNVNTI